MKSLFPSLFLRLHRGFGATLYTEKKNKPTFGYPVLFLVPAVGRLNKRAPFFLHSSALFPLFPCQLCRQFAFANTGKVNAVLLSLSYFDTLFGLHRGFGATLYTEKKNKPTFGYPVLFLVPAVGRLNKACKGKPASLLRKRCPPERLAFVPSALPSTRKKEQANLWLACSFFGAGSGT